MCAQVCAGKACPIIHDKLTSGSSLRVMLALKKHSDEVKLALNMIKPTVKNFVAK